MKMKEEELWMLFACLANYELINDCFPSLSVSGRHNDFSNDNSNQKR
jgi:hypothetical protein